MKVYTKLVYDMTTGELLEEESFDYDGPVAEAKGGDPEVKETEYEKELARIGEERWNRYQDVFAPVEELYAQQVRTTDSDREQAQGVAGSAVQQQFQGALEKMAGGYGDRGINTSAGGAGTSAMDSLADDRAASQALATVDADQGMTDVHYQGLEDVIQMGRGKATSGFRGISDIATSANQRAINDAQRSFQQRAGNLQAAGAIGGMGTASAMKAWGGGESAPAWGDNSVINDPAATAYHQNGGYRGSGF
ncbi:hypothetical protein KBTX_02791 [wastewater metagenome]|uniref:Uncharacterized protein n=2 Tax=unclassified sequences TaxID=12908 RepID=A0A5B8REI4_9ZZZZ|nr:hypothetical protein [Arhodomonas sp. KWT]QEA06453.1 hypothetical protein KBTEX_02791 [uncultured organism]